MKIKYPYRLFDNRPTRMKQNLQESIKINTFTHLKKVARGNSGCLRDVKLIL